MKKIELLWSRVVRPRSTKGTDDNSVGKIKYMEGATMEDGGSPQMSGMVTQDGLVIGSRDKVEVQENESQVSALVISKGGDGLKPECTPALKVSHSDSQQMTSTSVPMSCIPTQLHINTVACQINPAFKMSPINDEPIYCSSSDESIHEKTWVDIENNDAKLSYFEQTDSVDTKLEPMLNCGEQTLAGGHCGELVKAQTEVLVETKQMPLRSQTNHGEEHNETGSAKPEQWIEGKVSQAVEPNMRQVSHDLYYIVIACISVCRLYKPLLIWYYIERH